VSWHDVKDLLAVAAVVAWLFVWPRLKRRRRRLAGVTVLGLQMAAAEAVERERLEQDPEPSPLDGKSYSSGRVIEGEVNGHSLFRVERNEVDEAVRTLVAEFRSGSAEDREALTFRLSMGDLYTLMQFAKRSVVFALRERNPERCVEGMAALAAIDIERVDFRDLYSAVGLVDAAARYIDADVGNLYKTIVPLATSATQRPFDAVRARPAKDRTFRACLYAVADTPSGPALVESRSVRYSGSLELLELAVRASELVSAPAYQRAEFTVATKIPPIALESDDPRVEEALERSLGTVELDFKEKGQRNLMGQLSHIYLSKVASEGDASLLVQAARREEPEKSATVAFSTGRLLCVATTRSLVQGKPSIESSETLRAKLEPVRELLTREGSQITAP
jgi:hypothetical protein